MMRFRIVCSLAGLLGLGGCGVMTVAGTAVGVATTAVSVTTDVAVAAGKGVVKAGSWAVDAAKGDKPVATAANPVVNESTSTASPVSTDLSMRPMQAEEGLEIRPLVD